MSRTVYLNGEFLPEEKAMVSVFDRGFLFADAVYEATSVIGGKLLDFDGHMTRLRRSLGILEISFDVNLEEMRELHRELIRLNDLKEGVVYLQVSRGAADRSFIYPGKEVSPTFVMFTQSKDTLKPSDPSKGISVVTAEDLRWGRRDIKTVQLLYPSMVKMAAAKAGADDAWLVEDGQITEGTSNNAFIVTRDGTIVTRELSNDILHGVTRAAVLRFANETQITVEERSFTPAEASDAVEAFITSASNYVMPVVAIDGKPIGNGKPGPITRRLREIYIEESCKQAV